MSGSERSASGESQGCVRYMLPLPQTPKGRCLKTFSVMIRDHDLVQGPWMVDSIDSDCYFMFPLPQPVGGVVCIAECTSVWYNRGSTKAADPPHLKVSSSQTACVYKIQAMNITCTSHIYHMHITHISHAHHTYITCTSHIYHMHITHISHAHHTYITCTSHCVLYTSPV